jgi:hypothetical protein
MSVAPRAGPAPRNRCPGLRIPGEVAHDSDLISLGVPARRTQIYAATSFLALSRSNSPFSKPPTRPEFS